MTKMGFLRHVLSSTLSILLGVTQQLCQMVQPRLCEFSIVMFLDRQAKTLLPKMRSDVAQGIGKANFSLGIPSRAARPQRARELLLQLIGHQSDQRKQT